MVPSSSWLAAALLVGQALTSQCSAFGGPDPLVLVVSVVVLLLTTAVAASVPARRATRIDPARALRDDLTRRRMTLSFHNRG